MINLLLPNRAATIQTLGHPAAGVIGWVDGSTNASGVPVTHDSALTFSAVWCAVRVIAETIATLPCMLYRRTSDDSREQARDDSRFRLVHSQPHPLMSAVSFFETTTADMVMGGNGYAEIKRDQMGERWLLEIRDPKTVKPSPAGDSIDYEITQPPDIIPADRMLHVAGLGGDGITGWSVVKYAAQSIGGGLAADQYAAASMANGATPNGILSHPARLDADARRKIRTDWDEVHKGSGKAGNIAIMHGGMTYQPISMSNEDAQFLESRQFNVREIARWFRLPPHMLADLADSSVRANIEQQAIEFIVYSLRPWLTRWQQTLNRKLLTRAEQDGLYFEFMLEALLQGDSAAQAQAFSVGRQWGWWSVNDIRKKMNLNGIGPDGDVYLQPGNMVPAGAQTQVGGFAQDGVPQTLVSDLRQNLTDRLQAIKDAASSLDDADAVLSERTRDLREVCDEIRGELTRRPKVQAQGWDSGASAVIEACNDLLQSHLTCMLKIERSAVTKAATECVHRGTNFIAWLDSWYPQHTAVVTGKVLTVVSAYDRVCMTDGNAINKIVHLFCGQHKRQLLDCADGDPAGFQERVEQVMSEWGNQMQTIKLENL